MLGRYYIVNSNGCWEWQGALSTLGYGVINKRFQGKSKTHFAHRWLYEKLRGSVPKPLQLDHLCRNRKCVNPNHLEPVLPVTNVRRSNATKLTQTMVDNIRKEYAASNTWGRAKRLATRYGISENHVLNIIYHRTWKQHIPDDFYTT